MAERTPRGKTAIVGIGETTYDKRNRSPHSAFKLTPRAVVGADAGSIPTDADGGQMP